MPVFNAEHFLHESLGSVLAQEFQEWELICVDDESNDNSLQILYEFSKIDRRIRVFTKNNEGPAKARKLAAAHATGDYIALLDADDALSPDFLSSTHQVALATGADVVMPVLIQNWQAQDNSEYNFNQHNDLARGQEITPRCAFLRTMPWSVHGCNLYESAHFKSFALTDISDKNNFNADELLTRYLLLYAKKIVVSGGTYYYRANASSITRAFSLRQLGKLQLNNCVFKLAKNEGFSESELSGLAHLFLEQSASLKYEILLNKRFIPANEFREAVVKLEQKGYWEVFLRLTPSLFITFLFWKFYPDWLSSFLRLFHRIRYSVIRRLAKVSPRAWRTSNMGL
jgi:glycosyltransferase involved in cell wall biosynthesis